ncbi:hypothetical protein JCM10207_001034 [Rhodosporidiobolus poonsookiae]
MSASSSTAGSSPTKRKALDEEFKAKMVSVLFSKSVKPEWSDMAFFCAKKNTVGQLLSLPVNVLDRILGDPALNLRDHLSLASVCRTLRACYYTALSSDHTQPDSPLWTGLLALRPLPHEGAPGVCTECADAEARAVGKIWTRGVRVDPLEMEVVGKEADAVSTGKKGKRTRGVETGWEGKAIRSYGWEKATLVVLSTKITRTEAQKAYKVNAKQLDMLKCEIKNNWRGGAPIRLYSEAAVESLALRLHGGVAGHKALIAKRTATAKKAADTRAKNGTTGRGGRKKKNPTLTDAQLAALLQLAGGAFPYGANGLDGGAWDEFHYGYDGWEYDGEPECG